MGCSWSPPPTESATYGFDDRRSDSVELWWRGEPEREQRFSTFSIEAIADVSEPSSAPPRRVFVRKK